MHARSNLFSLMTWCLLYTHILPEPFISRNCRCVERLQAVDCLSVCSDHPFIRPFEFVFILTMLFPSVYPFVHPFIPVRVCSCYSSVCSPRCVSNIVANQIVHLFLFLMVSHRYLIRLHINMYF